MFSLLVWSPHPWLSCAPDLLLLALLWLSVPHVLDAQRVYRSLPVAPPLVSVVVALLGQKRQRRCLLLSSSGRLGNAPTTALAAAALSLLLTHARWPLLPQRGHVDSSSSIFRHAGGKGSPHRSLIFSSCLWQWLITEVFIVSVHLPVLRKEDACIVGKLHDSVTTVFVTSRCPKTFQVDLLLCR